MHSLKMDSVKTPHKLACNALFEKLNKSCNIISLHIAHVARNSDLVVRP